VTTCARSWSTRASGSRSPAAAGAGVERVKQGGIDLVVSDVKMPDLDGLDLLREVREVQPAPYVITITAFGSIDTAIRA
jgi:two-component system response regulator AtoC